MLKEAVRTVVRIATPPLIRNKPIAEWPGWLGQVHGVEVPQSLERQAQPAPTGSANINILVGMIERTKQLAGEIADCGVYRGGTTLGMGLYLHQHEINKMIYGFDSFEGFDQESVVSDMKMRPADGELQARESNETRRDMVSWRVTRFKGTSVDEVWSKVRRFKLKNIKLVPGYFNHSLPAFPKNIQFCFVHLDVNLYDSYKGCLEFFYPRVVSGGIVLLDEYNDPPWPGCNKAVDEFLRDRPEKLQMAESDNYQKWYFVKS